MITLGALIKQAIGMIFGDTQVEAEATTEIAAIEAEACHGPSQISESSTSSKGVSNQHSTVSPLSLVQALRRAPDARLNTGTHHVPSRLDRPLA